MNKSPSELNRHGKVFEKDIDEAFNKLYLTYPCKWERVLDSAAARNAVRASDGDFSLRIESKVYGRPYCFSVECKASNHYVTLAKCIRRAIKSGQYGRMRLAIRRGECGVYLFYSVENEEMEVWDAGIINEAWPHKRTPFHGRPAFVIAKPNFKRFARSMITDPQAVVDALIRTRN